MNSELTLTVASRPAASAMPPKVDIRPFIPENDGAAPWWADVIIERVANSDLSPTFRALIDEYESLARRLDDLAGDGDVDASAVAAAQTLLWRALMSRAVAPRLSFHRDSVVFFWTVGEATRFFTIDATSFSFLEEVDGVITKRAPDLELSVWHSIFAPTHGLH